MYIAPIVRAKPPVSAVVRRATGAVVLPLSAAVMLPFLLVYAVYAGVALTLRALAKLPRTLVEMVDYAGSVVLGR